MEPYKLGNFLLNNIDKDVEDNYIKLISSDKKIVKIHKCVARKSDFLNLIINDNNSNEDLEINLQFEIKYLDLVRNYMYLDKIKLDENNFEILIKISDFLSLHDLLILVSNWIFDYHLVLNNAIKILKLVKNSSLSTMDYNQRIIKYIKNNILNIISLDDIQLLNFEQYCEFLTDNLNQNYIFKSIEIWLKNKTNKEKKEYFKKFLNYKLYPGLLDLNIIWEKFLPYVDKINFEIKKSKLLKYIELSSFKSKIDVSNKENYKKYLWAMNLKVNTKIEILIGILKWEVGVIEKVKFIPGLNKYMNNLELKIKLENGFTETIKLPYELNRIDYLYKNTQNWRKDIDVEDIFDIKIENSNYSTCKVVYKKKDFIVVYLYNGNYCKLNINSKDITPSCNLKYNYYFLLTDELITINYKIFNKMELNKKYNYLELQNLNSE